jgi:hypothetical protein
MTRARAAQGEGDGEGEEEVGGSHDINRAHQKGKEKREEKRSAVYFNFFQSILGFDLF